MLKIRVKSVRRLGALAIFSAGFISFLGASGFSWAEETVPVPERKPAFENKKEIIKYSLQDFAKVLLDYGVAPVPRAKPFYSGRGPLSTSDAAIYKKVFALQADGEMKAANSEIAKLKDMRLRGHVLYQRYMHPTAYTTQFEELRNWMDLYADHPKAIKIYNLAMRKKPSDFKGHIKEPQTVKGISIIRDPVLNAGQRYKSQKKRNKAEKADIRAFQKSVKSLVYKGSPTAAYKKLEADERARLLDSVEIDLLKAKIAVGYLHAGKTQKAYALADEITQRSGLHVPMAGWVAGLVAWQAGDYNKAAKFFEITARSPYASGWTSAAGSYWAARSYTRTRNVRAVNVWLKRATEHPRTFYGLIATRALGRDFDFNWKVPSFSDEYQELLSKTPAGQRALSLVSAGQLDLAEAELLRLNPGKNKAMRDALLAYAGHAGLPGLALRLGSAISDPQGAYYDAALYPKGPWEPKDGYKIDPALVHAIMRQESRFNPSAESPSGAMGLMQLMPRTAKYVAGRSKASTLTNPEVNLEIGQKYLTSLLRDRNVEGDLLSLLIAYNAGPGNLSRWRKQWSEVDDPLLFIELIPSKETRSYVERVLANYWIYRLRENLDTPTLDAVAKGQVARYADAGYIAPYRIAAK